MSVDKEEQNPDPIKRSHRHNEYKHNSFVNEDIPGEIAALSTYEIPEKNSRFKDPYIEYVYSSRSPTTNQKTVGNLLHQTETEKVVEKIDTPEKIEKFRYDDKFYSKIYRNPILNKREKINTKKDEVDQRKTEPGPISSYNEAYNDEKYSDESKFKKPYPVYKGPVIRHSEEPNSDKNIKGFYTSTYNKCYENQMMSATSTPQLTNCNSNNSQTKLRPLNGNLNENPIKGKYFCRDDNSKIIHKLKSRNDPIIYPFKN